jgi:hypothetical protein
MSLDVNHLDVDTLNDNERPATRAQVVVGKAAQLLLYFLCLAPIALFPFGLAYKVYTHFFP